MHVTIHVIEGPAKGQHFTFEKPDCFLVGRTADAHISLPDDPYLSRQHFLLAISPPDCTLTDLDSKNGVFVNGVRYGGRKPPKPHIKQAPGGVKEVRLNDNDTITVGSTRIKIAIQAPSAEKVHVNVDRATTEKLGKLLDARGYQLDGELMRSGKGSAYKATSTKTGKSITIKTMDVQMAVDPARLKHFQQELKLIQQLRHHHIVPLLAHGKIDQSFYVVFQFVEGDTLAEFIQSHPPRMPLNTAAPLLLGILDGLAYAHRVRITMRSDGEPQKGFQGLVHRDVQPQNVVLARDGNYRIPRLTDFGLTKGFASAGFTNIARTDGLLGAPMYWPREQITHYAYPTLVTDVFSAAAVCYEILTGEWVREGFTELLRRCRQQGGAPSISDYLNVIAANPPIPIRERNSDLPQPVAEVIDQALREEEIPHDPVKMHATLTKLRYADAGLFRDALAQALAQIGIATSPGKAGYAYYEHPSTVHISKQVEPEQAAAGTIMYSMIRPSASRRVALFVLDVAQSTQHILNMGDTRFNSVIGHIFRQVKAHPASSEMVFLKCTGDGFLAVFGSISAAFSVAASFLETGVHPHIHIRIALHWGAVKTGPDGDVIGTEVHRVCRIEGVKPADQLNPHLDATPLPAVDRVLITQAGLAQLDDSDRAQFKPAGTFRLKGFNTPCDLWVYSNPT